MRTLLTEAVQALAAARLGLPFSTYRRHFTGGIERICESRGTAKKHVRGLIRDGHRGGPVSSTGPTWAIGEHLMA
ncbi:hypothetical protein ACTXG5_12770 [Mycobacterium sp. Dal123C01]|uniref:hypothetical protein n=1 Tax=Mycobacterium sp. Dal123C01 TaxID=3457577 RepID=UPI00403E3B83